MRRLLSGGLMVPGALLVLAASWTSLVAQGEEGTVSIEPAENGSSLVVLAGAGASQVDAFEVVIAVEDAGVTAADISAGPGWSLIPESLSVDGGTVTAAAFAIEPPCAGDRCVLLVIASSPGVGATNTYSMAGALVLSAGEELAVGLGIAADAVANEGGGEPRGSIDQSSDDGIQPGFVLLWFVGIAGALVAVAGFVIGGTRWIWNRGGRVTVVREAPPPAEVGTEQLAGVDELFDRIAELGDFAGRSEEKTSEP